MHAKYALALILALQVSVSLCDLPPPSQELVDKYNMMRTTFARRISNLAERMMDMMQPVLLTETEDGRTIKNCIDTFINGPPFQAASKVLTALVHEFTPMVDTTRMNLLAKYEYTLRPQIGEALNRAIETIKVYLDRFMPAE